jgi:hypothetical protein
MGETHQQKVLSMPSGTWAPLCRARLSATHEGHFQKGAIDPQPPYARLQKNQRSQKLLSLRVSVSPCAKTDLARVVIVGSIAARIVQGHGDLTQRH